MPPNPAHPIFVHASQRGGSTYFFNVLRRLPGLICFNEPFNEHFVVEPAGATTERQKQDLNHDFLELPPHHEFKAAWDEVMPNWRAGIGVRGYLPAGGVLAPETEAYIAGFARYAESIGKRLAFCEIQSQGRAGAIRDAFGGFHAAQIRDPLSQWGALYRQLEEHGNWWFMAQPLLQLGINANHPLYRLVPETLRLPRLPWPVSDRWTRHATLVAYVAPVKRGTPPALAATFERYLWSWMLNHIAAVSFSDLVLDGDRLFHDLDHRNAVSAMLETEIGAAPDFFDLRQFDRHYEYEGFDIVATTEAVLGAMRDAARDGRIAEAVRALAQQPPRRTDAAALVIAKTEQALARLQAAERKRVTNDDWAATARKSRLRWQSPVVRAVARRVEPLVWPFLGRGERDGPRR